jgi:hypothetical protein
MTGGDDDEEPDCRITTLVALAERSFVDFAGDRGQQFLLGFICGLHNCFFGLLVIAG